MAKLLVKQVRSKINCPLTQKRTLEALGLRKRLGQVVEHDANPAILGMVNKVKHLVSVEETK
jgi:large subunit ribosomal protein L30